MQRVELLMSTFGNLNYIFDKKMPCGQKGLYIDGNVYLNPHQSYDELTSTVAEEIAHHLTSYGYITDYNKLESRKQERKARLEAAKLTLHPMMLIQAYNKGCREAWEVAEELEITVKALNEGIELFKEKYGNEFTYGNYRISFGVGNSIKIKHLD